MSVSAIIVTRGDVDLTPILEALPGGWEQIVWDNSGQVLRNGELVAGGNVDLSVYGRYAAIEYASHDLIYAQDDDCIVSDPQAIVDEWFANCEGEVVADGLTMMTEYEGVVCNMPERFRGQGIYATGEHALVGFGAAFHRDAPTRAFTKFLYGLEDDVVLSSPFVQRTCDIAFTALTPRVLVDVPHEDLPWAHAENRMWKQREHVAERTRMLELVRRVK